jgi:hypothetical protein
MSGYNLCLTCARFVVSSEQSSPIKEQCVYLSQKLTSCFAYYNAAIQGLPRPPIETLPIQDTEIQQVVCPEFQEIPGGPV